MQNVQAAQCNKIHHSLHIYIFLDLLFQVVQKNQKTKSGPNHSKEMIPKQMTEIFTATSNKYCVLMKFT